MCCVENINYDSLFDDTKWVSYCKVSLTSLTIFTGKKRCPLLHVSTNTHMNSIDPCCSMPGNTPEAGLSWEISKCWQISLCCRHGACTLFTLHLLMTCFMWAETPQLKYSQIASKKWSQVGHSWLKQQTIKRCAPPLLLLKVAPKDGASCEDLQIWREQNHRPELLYSTRWVTEWSKQRSFQTKAFQIFSCKEKKKKVSLPQLLAAKIQKCPCCMWQLSECDPTLRKVSCCATTAFWLLGEAEK